MALTVFDPSKSAGEGGELLIQALTKVCELCIIWECNSRCQANFLWRFINTPEEKGWWYPTNCDRLHTTPLSG